ncbi:unnamed protein product [Nezara viridula]|uniref:Zinc-finger domain-containing protein n=1 Tax=Nezara viridula TaxID=85310 RepID=A0A9P0H4K5_NEZVI|nr:unnamed protein product [Nezara viridula]
MSSDYEQMRESNIKEFRELFKKQFGEYPGQTTVSSVAAEFQPTDIIDEPQKRKRSYHRNVVLSPQRRSARLQAKAGSNWTNTGAEYAKIRYLRRMAGRTRRDLVRNQRIQQELGVSTVKEVVEKRQLKWFGHLCQMEEDRDPRKYFKARPTERRPRGRPRLMWTDHFTKLGQQRGRGLNAMKALARDRDATLKTKLKKIRKSVTPRVSLKREIIPPEAVNDDDLEKICYRSAGKVYDSKNGSTCHQCRQKTVDVKSICRNKDCVGIRGQFCGFCLHNRYGEDVATTLKDPNWSCPPCRNICNCSICRRRLGKLPTGILVPEAQSRGFSNVKDFLETVDEDKLIKMSDGDEEESVETDP